MFELLTKPWPWYVGGPLLGLIVPILLIVGNKSFGISSTFRHYCAACMSSDIPFFEYNWKKRGSWNVKFVVGTIIGAFLAGSIFRNPKPVQISADTVTTLKLMGIQNFQGLVPLDLFNWQNLLTLQGIMLMVGGGFFVGFGSRYAGGCTSGHAITGLANLQPASIMAVIGFFIGGLISTYLLLPLII